jgi:hypothetical protein
MKRSTSAATSLSIGRAPKNGTSWMRTAES